MLVRVFYNDLCKDISLDGTSRFTIGSSNNDSFCISDFGLRKGHVILTPRKSGWEISCNGEVSLKGVSFKKEALQMSVTYVLSQEHRVSMICLDDSNVQMKSVELMTGYDVSIGRHQDNQIVFQSPLVSGHHAQIKKIGNSYYVKDLGSTNGTYLNEKRISECMLSIPDKVIVGQFQIVFHGDSLEILSFEEAVQVRNAPPQKADLTENVDFVRSPRLKLEEPRGGVEIEAPPSVTGKPDLNLASMLLPVIGTIGVAVATTVITGNSRMLLYTLPMTLIGLIVSFLNFRKQKKNYYSQIDVRLEKYTEHLNKTIEVVEAKQREQMTALLEADPDLNTCFEMARSANRKLWSRKPLDSDFISVRVGTGTIPSSFKINIPKESISLDNDELKDLPGKIYQKYHMIHRAPVTCGIFENQICGVVGAQKDIFPLVNNMVAQIATHHCYTEVKIIFVYDEKDEAQFSWVKMLPHAMDDEKTNSLVAVNKQSAGNLFRLFGDILKSRKHEMDEENSYGTTAIPIPYYLFVIAQPSYLGRSDSITEYLFRNKELNAGVILAVESLMQLPKECSLIIEADQQKWKMYHRENASTTQEFVVDCADPTEYQRFSSNLGHIVCEEKISKSTIPQKYSFFDMLRISSIRDLDLDTQWSASNVTKSIAVPLGIGDGKDISLDLHEKAHGPHGLVAGTTGSGKSELLQSYILSVALQFHPHEVGFVVIDFKGGGMANQFEKLPHLLGSITNIEGNAINRSLASIRAELMKRQHVFAEANVNSIDKYIEKYQNGEVTEPLPHLIIVVDEFAELKAEQPEFMKELISAARIGRSLGIHLILATQKPSGQINEQIWSNSRFKICLKVASREDSNEVLHSTAAFNIKEPGRAYLQVGNNEVFELFQSGYSGEKTVAYGNSCTQLEAVVEHIRQYCANKHIEKLPNICLPPLPDNIPYCSARTVSCNSILAYVGRYDLPTNQAQGDIVLDFCGGNLAIIGSPQSGKTNLLQTIIRSLCEQYTSDQVNFYIVDFASMLLKNFESCAHVGGVVISQEDEKLENLFKMLLEEIDRRKKIFISKGVGSHNAYRDAGFTDLPQIILMIDNLTALQELYPATEEPLLSVCREGLSVGISVVFANGQTAGIGYKFMMNFPRRIALHCNDSSEYSSMFDRSRMTVENIPGRCLIEVDHQIVEAQIYQCFNGEREIDRVDAVRKFVAMNNSDNGGLQAKRIPVVPSIVTMDSLEANGVQVKVDNYQIPLGIDYTTMQVVYLDMLKHSVLAVSGNEHSGKTNLTLHILSSIQKHIFDNVASVYIADNTGRLDIASEFGCVEQFVRKSAEAKALIDTVHAELQNRRGSCEESDTDNLPLLMLVLSGQNLLSTLLQDAKTAEKLSAIAKDSRQFKIFVLLSDLENAAINFASPAILKQIKENYSFIALDNIGDVRIIDIPGKFLKEFGKNIRLGDGFSFLGGKVRKIHFILYHTE